jgi:photosystem II stability/assembly factor-like uncharacterized protein
MKKIYIVFLILFFTSKLYSQAWIINLPQNKAKTELNLFDYKNAFETYWTPFNVSGGMYKANGIDNKAIGWKQFKRWEYFIERQINPTTGELPKQTALEVYNDFLKANSGLLLLKSSSAAGAPNWTSLGPNSSTGGYAGVGRVNCITFHPTDRNIYWIGVASGGLWGTTNNGISWTCLTDTNNSLAVSDIIIPTDYAVSNTIYIATGDRDHWDNRSIGVLKSTNGGVTWNPTGLNFTLAEGKMVNRLLLDPNNNQVIIAATNFGVYKTTDGGTTWSNSLTSIAFIDMEFKPGDFNTLYGSTQDGKIYTSSNGGVKWTLVSTITGGYRTELAVSPDQPGYVYALAANSIGGLNGVYRSTDSGLTFAIVFDGATKNLLGWSLGDISTDGKGQGSYDLSLAVSLTSANTLLLGGINTWKSTDGGVNWTMVNVWNGATGIQTVHADKHMLKYRSNGDLFECNDGGLYISTDNGNVWFDKTNGLVISQMYKLGVSSTVPNETITGLQDNGSKLLSGVNWTDVKGGDGMECLIDYTDVNIQYGTYTNGQISRTTNHWGSATNIQPADAGTGAWVTPYVIDPIDPKILYAGYADVWKTTNRGDTWTKLSIINSSGKIRSMAIAASNAQVLYVGEQSKLWKTFNGGTSWSDVTGTLPVGSGNITSVAIKNDDENTLWVTMGGFNALRVFQSTNGGASWTNISTGLPQIPAYSIVQNKQSVSEVQLYVGTELGVYFKKGVNGWALFNTNLPNVSIGELEIYYASNPQDSKIRAATFGRGLWESPVVYSLVPMAYVSSTTTQNNTSAIAPNQINQVIVGVQIVNSGSLAPFNAATSFTFNSIGSTNPITDITKAKLYYTGTSASFASTTQFGSTVNSPNGTFNFDANQTLSDGINYFWLTYDIPATATMNDYVDAQCTSLTVGTVKTPTVTDPAGNRQIAIKYCTAGATTSGIGYISRVRLNTIDQTSLLGANGYEDYTSQVASMQIGTPSAITINRSAAYFKDSLFIWVDWNRNGDFTDVGERVYVSPGVASMYTTSFTPPASAAKGVTQMRIRLHNYTYLPNTTPCGTSYYGEVEDYSINVTGTQSPPLAPVANNIINILPASCSVSWSEVVGAIGYVLDIATDNLFTNFLPGFNNMDIGNLSSYPVTGLNTTTLYYYRVRAYNLAGSSLNSNKIAFSTLVITPAVPLLNTATNVLQTSLTAKWSSAANATGYRLDVATNSGFTSLVSGYTDKDVSNVLITSITGLSPKTVYFVRARAYNSSGSSGNSNTISATTLSTPPPVPNILTSSSCNDLITLQWQKSTGPDVVLYRIYGGLTINPTVKIDSTTDATANISRNISGLIRGQFYYFRVTAVNYDGPESTYSSQFYEKVKRGVMPFIKAKWSDLLICSNLGDSITNYQWFKGSTAIPNAKAQNYVTDKQTGVYSVQTTDINGCNNFSNVVTITGLKSLSVFPNPASVSFALKINDAYEGKANVSIINSSGIKVKEFQVSNLNDEQLKEIPVSNLNPGVYIIKVLLDNKELYYSKIVVSK